MIKRSQCFGLTMFLCAALAVPRAVNADSSGVWGKATDMPMAVQEIYPVVQGSNIYVAGGFTQDGASNLTMIYDIEGGFWVAGPTLPHSTHHIQLVSHDGAVLAVGGYTISRGKVWNMNAGVHRLDVVENIWVPMPDLVEARAESVAATIDGMGIITSGRTLRGTATGEREDHVEATDTLVLRPGEINWRRAAPIPTPRMSGAGAVLNGRLHVLGGRVHTGTGISYQKLDTHEAYDPKSDRWEILAPLPQAVAGIAAASLDGRLCVFGGEDNVEPYEVYIFAWCYDPETNRWSDITPLPVPLHGHGAVSAMGQIHILGGSITPGKSGTTPSHYTLNF